MDNSDKENYFSIYMQKKESINKKKKLSPEKSNKTLKNSNFSNLHIPQGQSLKKLVFVIGPKRVIILLLKSIVFIKLKK